MQASEFAAS